MMTLLTFRSYFNRRYMPECLAAQLAAVFTPAAKMTGAPASKVLIDFRRIRSRLTRMSGENRCALAGFLSCVGEYGEWH